MWIFSTALTYFLLPLCKTECRGVHVIPMELKFTINSKQVIISGNFQNAHYSIINLHLKLLLEKITMLFDSAMCITT